MNAKATTGCTTDRHEQMKNNPVARRLYAENFRDWSIGSERLRIFECVSCHSTLAAQGEVAL